ncbi:hypothetical protein [Pantoea sp. Cy-639]|uniref:hypothetical protein n=1 Tax=Pantoea sp. Cy-639 TaxID=2608360 RepID=UPI0014205478|nr:hypothetical protein [Pantoea sp. Cy-639]NIF19826.1 hypothetical protein [Pantoea sp. Cy-639]
MGIHMMNNGKSPEAVARAMAPPPPRPIATFECRASATVAGGLGVSVAGAVNEVSGISRQVSVPMTSFAARIAGRCGIKIADPDAKNFTAGLAGAMSFGLVSVEAGQNSSGGELYIGVGPGIGPELKIPYSPNQNLSIHFETK